MIEESEKMDLENVEEYARMLSQALPPSITVAALNGHMRSTEKNEIMERFSKNEIQVLVSTTVVEVGVDVPECNGDGDRECRTLWPCTAPSASWAGRKRKSTVILRIYFWFRKRRGNGKTFDYRPFK